MKLWNRKKIHFPLLVFVFSLFLVFSILHNERSILQIQENPDRATRHQIPVTYVKPNRLSHQNHAPGIYASFCCKVWIFYVNSWWILYWVVKLVVFLWFDEVGLSGVLWVSEVLDRFSACNSTREYSGRKIAWTDHPTPEYGRRRKSLESCDVFSGKWVFDNSSYPLYNESECPYMSDQLACHKHGRSDLGYQYWRWQPHNCNLKR